MSTVRSKILTLLLGANEYWWAQWQPESLRVVIRRSSVSFDRVSSLPPWHALGADL